jgi:hypothetical protein
MVEDETYIIINTRSRLQVIIPREEMLSRYLRRTFQE